MPRSVLSVFDLAPRRIGGVEVFARELSLQLAAHGWKSVLAFDAEAPEAVGRYLALPNVVLETLDFQSRPLRAFAALVRKHRPEIVHLYFTPFVGWYPWLARLSGAQRVFFTDQGSQPPHYVPQRAPSLKRWVGRLCTRPLERAICISDYNVRSMTVRGFLPPSRIVRIYNAVDLEQPCGDGAAFRRRFGIPANAVLILQVSSISPEKGVPDLLEAAGIVLARYPSAHFVFVGDGRWRGEYAAEADNRGLAGHVTWTGLVGNPTREGAYAAADIFCLVSRWQEGFGWVIAEAMACGRPAVGTRAGAIPEVITDGVTGYLASPGNAAEIAEKILALLADPALRARMGAAARAGAENRFDVRRNVAELIRLYGIG